MREMIKTAKPALLLKLAALVYDRQTREEQEQGQTLERNGVGFNKSDAYPVTTTLAKFQRGLEHCSPEGLVRVARLRTRLSKYGGQISDILQSADSVHGLATPRLDLEREIYLTSFFEYPTHIIALVQVANRAAGNLHMKRVRLPKKHVDLDHVLFGRAMAHVPLWLLRKYKLVDENDKSLVVAPPDERERIKREKVKKGKGLSAARQRQMSLVLLEL